MASTFRRKDSTRWIIKWRDRDGTWHNDPSSATTQAEALAEAIAKEAGTWAPVSSTGRPNDQPIPRKTAPEVQPGPLLRHIIERWLKEHSTTLRDHVGTTRKSKHILSDRIAGIELSALRASDVEMFLAQKASSLGPQSLNHLRKIINAAINWSIRLGHWEGTNVVLRVRPRKVTKHEYDWLTLDELRIVLLQVNDRWRGPFAVMAYAGLRKGECLSLRRQDIDVGLKGIRVRRSWDSDVPKGGSARSVPIADILRPFIVRALKGDAGLLFPAPGGGMFSPDVRPQDELRRAVKEAGIDRPKIRLHDLRHSCASNLANAGVSMHLIQRILGHSTIVLTNDLYSHIRQDALDDAMKRMG